jgi:hypothetical protein
MPHDRIDGKFYPLQHDEWLRACQEPNSVALTEAISTAYIFPSTGGEG